MQINSQENVKPPPKLLDRVRHRLRLQHASLRTEHAYVSWIERFIRFHKLRHPSEMGVAEIERFLTYLAVERHISASTQNQAFNALVFLYQQVLEIDLGRFDALRARRTRRLPVVLSRGEVKQLLDGLATLPTRGPWSNRMKLQSWKIAIFITSWSVSDPVDENAEYSEPSSWIRCR